MRTMRIVWGVILLGCGLGSAWAVDNPSLSLETFLGQVKSQGPGYRAAAQAVKGLEKQKVQADLLYTPHLKGSAGRKDDRMPGSFPYQGTFIGYDHLIGDSYSVGVEKLWKYGVYSSVEYGWMKGDVVGLGKIYQTSPTVSVAVPLWRDFLGRQTRAQMDKMKYGLESAEYGAAHQREQMLYQARQAYWGLQLSREEVAIRNDTLARATTLVSWAQRRVNMRLAEKSELLQAKAMKQVRELELEQALENERAARVGFNRLRGVEDEEVPENLQPLEPQMAALAFAWPETAPKRWDVRSAEAKIAADKAAWVDAKANAWPDLKVTASYTANGMGPAYSDAVQASRDDHHPTGMVGASIDIPLDVFTAKKSADGYALNYQASKAAYDDKTLSVRQEWLQLKRRAEDVERRLALATEIEKIQKAKAEEERRMLDLGRSTQFQVQSYESDYQLSRLQRLAVIAQKLGVWAEGEWMMSADKESNPQK